jgi:two-component system NarL family response regulator
MRKNLPETIRAVHRGMKYIQSEVAAQIADHIGEASLSPREIEVILLVAAGNSNKRIGAKLSINEDTVKGHMTNIMLKLGASDRTHAVTLAVRRGIIQL